MQVQLNSIGTVAYRNGVPVIVLDGKVRDGLNGLNGFSHIVVIWWAHNFADDMFREITVMDAPYTEGPEKIGVFATRSPVRPNPVAVSTVQIASIDFDQGEIHVPYIDAEEGTPVMDIKPYHPAEDRVRDVQVPGWCDSWPKWLEESADFDWEKVFNF